MQTILLAILLIAPTPISPTINRVLRPLILTPSITFSLSWKPVANLHHYELDFSPDMKVWTVVTNTTNVSHTMTILRSQLPKSAFYRVQSYTNSLAKQSISLEWDPSSNDVLGYRIVAWNQNSTNLYPTGDITSITISNKFSAGSSYFFHCVAIGPKSDSPPSNQVSFNFKSAPIRKGYEKIVIKRN